MLGQIDSAFQRLDEGTYGICRNCLLIMPRGQLLMQPYAEVCTDCRSRKAA
jgi:RNA polymerase-binding transcription factor DksA